MAAAQLERCLDEPAASSGRVLSIFGPWIQARISYERDGPVVAVKTLAGVFDNLAANKRVLLEEPAMAAWMVRTALAAGDHKRATAVADAAVQLSANNTGFPSARPARAPGCQGIDKACFELNPDPTTPTISRNDARPLVSPQLDYGVVKAITGWAAS